MGTDPKENQEYWEKWLAQDPENATVKKKVEAIKQGCKHERNHVWHDYYAAVCECSDCGLWLGVAK